MLRIVSDPARVYAYVAAQVPLPLCEGMKGLGLERDGELVAGVLYEGFNRYNVWMHVATHRPRRWLTRRFLWFCYHYPFEQAGVRRISSYVRASNAPCVRFLEHMGWRREATLTGAASDGGDALVYVMWREQCRFIGGRYGQGI